MEKYATPIQAAIWNGGVNCQLSKAVCLTHANVFEFVYFVYVIYYIYFLCECLLQKCSLILKCPTAHVLPQISRSTATYLELVYRSIKKLYVELLYIYELFIICPNLTPLMYKTHIHFHKNCALCWRNIYGMDLYYRLQFKIWIVLAL